MKKVFLVCVAFLAFVATASAQITVVQCTEEEYKEALYCKFLCSCRYFLIAELSQSDSMHIDSVFNVAGFRVYVAEQHAEKRGVEELIQISVYKSECGCRENYSYVVAVD